MFVGAPPFSATPWQGLDYFGQVPGVSLRFTPGCIPSRLRRCRAPRRQGAWATAIGLVLAGRARAPEGALELEPGVKRSELRVWTNEEMLSP